MEEEESGSRGDGGIESQKGITEHSIEHHTPRHIPGHSTIVQPDLPLKFDPQSGLQVVLVLHIHDSSV